MSELPKFPIYALFFLCLSLFGGYRAYTVPEPAPMPEFFDR